MKTIGAGNRGRPRKPRGGGKIEGYQREEQNRRTLSKQRGTVCAVHSETYVDIDTKR